MQYLRRAAALGVVLAALGTGPTLAAPDNGKTLHFELTCDDGNVYQASFNGGPAAFHLDTGGLYIWKEIQFVTPTGESGVLTHGLQGFAASPTVTCSYTGAVSGNAVVQHTYNDTGTFTITGTLTAMSLRLFLIRLREVGPTIIACNTKNSAGAAMITTSVNTNWEIVASRVLANR